MIIGTGIDIVEIQRIAKLMTNEKFIKRVLTEREQAKLTTLSEKRKIEFLAGRFAAKEAYAKALGTGIGKELSFQDVEIVNDSLGKPFVQVENKNFKAHVSISHSHDYAIAQIILEGSSS
ncbi:holo-ACP synthase [Lottiidibacillus patelloidae]|uniref:Holo-[acyl-carrier-protein] synthase n=1 Tax=Lottiidibacillus patelloidae TaxID=2670334 RepID=A0A263BQW3_9BACI|nr:holo-ACP synthase [Lottiidibacillus patelloidae]OZM55767.1 holo-ACP synthase [Lottiidibacillus patelloidae]